VDDSIKETGCWLDCAKLYTNGGSVWNGSLTGLAYLNGETVTVVVDGATLGTGVPSGGTLVCTAMEGFVTGMTPGYIRVGLPYTGVLQPMKMDIVMKDGPSQGRTRKIETITARVSNSLGFSVGPTVALAKQVPFRSTVNPMDASPPLRSEDIKVYPNTGYDKSGDFVIVQNNPLPLTVLGLSVAWDIFQ
jgi:hypothetical protein